MGFRLPDPRPPGAPVVTEDGLRFYYWGARNTEERDGSSLRYNMHVGMATLRRDGFVSLDADNKAGTVVTRPMTFEGRRLYVNADLHPGGYLRVGLQDSSGESVPGCTLAECLPVNDDVDGARIHWRKSQEIPQTTNSPQRLVFELKNARLYSFWIE